MGLYDWFNSFGCWYEIWGLGFRDLRVSGWNAGICFVESLGFCIGGDFDVQGVGLEDH